MVKNCEKIRYNIFQQLKQFRFSNNSSEQTNESTFQPILIFLPTTVGAKNLRRFSTVMDHFKKNYTKETIVSDQLSTINAAYKTNINFLTQSVINICNLITYSKTKNQLKII